MKAFGELTPSQKMRRVGAMLLAVLFLVLAVFLVITLLTGDTTDHLEERQPSPSPAVES